MYFQLRAPRCWRVSLCNTQPRTVNLIHSVLRDDEGVTQARGCLRHETDRGFERWHCTIYCLEFCAGLNDAKRQHLSTINTNSDLSFTTIQQQTYRRKQSMGQADDNSLTALLAKRARVRLHEVVNTCTERRAEKRIQRTAWILSHVLHTTTQRRVNMWTVCAQPDGSMSSLLQRAGSSSHVLVHKVAPLAATTSLPF